MPDRASHARERRARLPCCFLLAAALLPLPVIAAEGGRLVATGGATQVEGAAGGGLVPWAVLAGYGTRDQRGGSAFFTRVETSDYALNAFGAAYTFDNRLELSLARQRLDLGTLRRQLSLPWDALEQDIVGAKLRLAGDLLYSAWPQVSAGIQYKRLRDDALPRLVGAEADRDADVYVSATKLLLTGAAGYPLLLSGGVRWTRANQLGLLGYSGSRTLQLEGSAAILLQPTLAIGVEYRSKPNALAFAREDDWSDLFVAWFPSKRVAVTAAWADLGDVATLRGQRGGYLSIQLSH